MISLIEYFKDSKFSILERLKLNTDSKITNRNGLKYGEWKDKIQNDFK